MTPEQKLEYLKKMRDSIRRDTAMLKDVNDSCQDERDEVATA